VYGNQNPLIMLRSTCLLFTLSVTGIATAQLGPHTPATPVEHLLEVNMHWTTMDPVVSDNVRSVQFTSEAERITEHLHRVREHLSKQIPKGLVPNALIHRRALLDTLDAYAGRGLFPVNNVVPGRSPVFIDELGTACAVGYLMIASGHADIAERIQHDMNLAYVHDIALPEMSTWAATHGFTAEELAWIQPTYERPEPLGPRMLASLYLVNGDLIVIEGPASAQAAQKMRMLRRTVDGDKPLATLPMLVSVQAVEFEGRVFVGGIPQQAGTAEVYEWNGRSLVAHDPFAGRVGISALYVQNGMLHVRAHSHTDGQAQERYLTAAGEWRPIEPDAPAPLPGTNVIVPEDRLP
jgi:hypothetical protein